jgi:hypothetical protein
MGATECSFRAAAQMAHAACKQLSTRGRQQRRFRGNVIEAETSIALWYVVLQGGALKPSLPTPLRALFSGRLYTVGEGGVLWCTFP